MNSFNPNGLSPAPAPSELEVTRADAGARLDLFLAGARPEFSRSRLQALIRAGQVRLNGKPARTRQIVRTGDRIALEEPAAAPLEQTAAEDIALDVLHEDDALLVINKPAGLVVHPAPGNREHTLVNALLHHCATLSGIGGIQRPGIVHRLDKETSGCIVVAKDDGAHANLSAQFAGREVLKVYLALVAGVPKRRAGVIEAPIARHAVHRQKMAVVRNARGRVARTDYRVLASDAEASLVECTLHSGRTHQIRVHLHHLGHPVLGDKLYGPRAGSRFARQMLHARRLGFRHPRTGEWRQFEAPMPEDFRELAMLRPNE